MGSKDRKAVSRLCYQSFRTALLSENLTVANSVLLGVALFQDIDRSDWQILQAEASAPELPQEFFELNLLQRLEIIRPIWEVNTENSHYNFSEFDSDFPHLNDSKLLGYQPKSWLRLDKEQDILPNLIPSDLVETAFAFDHGSTFEKTIQIQDLSSQVVCNEIGTEAGENIWDCCSGSGGKSLNISNKLRASFYLSDNRKAILENARIRLKTRSKIKFTMHDLSKINAPLTFAKKSIERGFFDSIIADVPCSGSGTWFRNPEHFRNFKYEGIEEYTRMQKLIVQNALPYLKKGGRLYYITCSIFNAENIELVSLLAKHENLKVIRTMNFDGTKHGADCMFFAELIKN